MFIDPKGRNARQLIPFGPQYSLNVVIVDLMKKEISSAAEMKFYSSYFIELMEYDDFEQNPSEIFRSMTSGYKTRIQAAGDDGGELDAIGVVDSARFDCLMANLVQLKSHYDRSLKGDPSKREALRKFNELFDCMSIESLRLSFEAQHAKNLTRQVESATKALNEAMEKADRLEGKANHLEDKLDRSQKEYIAILGIFAAVVVAVSSGVNFSLSAFDAVHGYHVVYLSFVISVIGIFLFNMLYALFTFMYRMIRQNGNNWGILGKDTFVKTNRFMVYIVAFLFFSSILMTFLEHSWSL